MAEGDHDLSRAEVLRLEALRLSAKIAQDANAGALVRRAEVIEKYLSQGTVPR